MGGGGGGMVIYDNEFETKENRILTKDDIYQKIYVTGIKDTFSLDCSPRKKC